MNNEIGNLSTIVKFISMTIAGYLIGALASKGLNLPIDADILSQMIGALIFFGLAYIDAKYPNTFKWLDNAPIEQALETEEDLINEDYYEEI